MALPGHHERTMMTFLDHPALWKQAAHLYHADTLSHWRKCKNLPKVEANPKAVYALLEKLAAQVAGSAHKRPPAQNQRWRGRVRRAVRRRAGQMVWIRQFAMRRC